MKIRVFLLSFLVATHAWAVDPTSDGLSYGASKNQGVFDAGNQDPTTLLPSFQMTVDQTTLMGDGTQITPVETGSTFKVSDCAINPANPDKYLRQECEAINWWQKNPSIRPQYNITRQTDPIVTKAVMINNNPQTVVGTMPGISGTYQDCVQNVIPGAKTYSTQYCSENLVLDPYSCQTNWDVQVDQDFAYKCHQSDYTLQTSSCIKNVTPLITYTETPYDVSTTTESAAASLVTNYSWVVKFNGTPVSLLLDWIKGGDYIQLWINGFQVYSNAPYADVRNTWWGNTPGSNCGNVLYTRAGVNLGGIGSNNCALTECGTGVNPNQEVKGYFHSGYNVIELTCINISGTARPCEFSITGSINAPGLDSVNNDGGCAVYETRAQ